MYSSNYLFLAKPKDFCVAMISCVSNKIDKSLIGLWFTEVLEDETHLIAGKEALVLAITTALKAGQQVGVTVDPRREAAQGCTH